MSCLFKSIGSCIKSNPEKVRFEICNYLESNKPIIGDIDTKEILETDRENYVDSMRNSNTWGGGIEIAAAANLYKIRICIHLLNKKKNKRKQKQIITFVPIDENYNETINLLYTGNHYQPCKY